MGIPYIYGALEREILQIYGENDYYKHSPESPHPNGRVWSKLQNGTVKLCQRPGPAEVRKFLTVFQNFFWATPESFELCQLYELNITSYNRN